jgi:uncharacterized tellurite resistance protein B-like protein
MIVWGSRGVTSSVRQGTFHCPQCRSRQPYELKKVQKYFSLYFIPLAPVKDLAEYVECQTCKQTFKTEVLQFDPEARDKAFLAAVTHAFRRVAVLTMLADGEPQSAECEALRQVYREHFKRELDPSAFDDEVARARADQRTLAEHLSMIAGQLNVQGKELLIRAALQVAVSDAPLGAEEQALIAEAGQALGLSTAHVRGLILEAGGTSS